MKTNRSDLVISDKIQNGKCKNNFQRKQLEKYLSKNVKFHGELREIRINRWKHKQKYIAILLKPVYIQDKKYDHIWIQTKLSYLKSLEPYIYQKELYDAKYTVYKPDYLIDEQNPKKVASIENLRLGNSTMSMYDIERLNNNSVKPTAIIHSYVISGKATVVKYRRNPKNTLLKHNINDGFSFDYGIDPKYSSLSLNYTTEKKYLCDEIYNKVRQKGMHISKKELMNLTIKQLIAYIPKLQKCIRGHEKQDFDAYCKNLTYFTAEVG